MKEPQPVPYSAFLQSFPPIWADETLPSQIFANLRLNNRCVVALDDDPTGTQTVHGIWVVTEWDVDSLRKVLADGEPAFYILTNSRSLPLTEAERINREIAGNLAMAARMEGRPIMVVSRSDSTLRGHFPGEVHTLEEGLVEAGMEPFDGICIIPFFPEGGRYTALDVHWVLDGDHLIPAAQTPYAQDRVFGYQNSHLPSWVQEKTGGKILASQVVSITLDHLRIGGPMEVEKVLKSVSDHQMVVVNALDYRDLEVFVRGLNLTESGGRRFLFRTAASFVKVAAGISKKPLLVLEDVIGEDVSGGGLIVVGSHVPRTTAQLEMLLKFEDIRVVELSVREILDERTKDQHVDQIQRQANASLALGTETVIYTSREVILGSDHASTLDIGKRVSSILIEIVRKLEVQPRYVLAKGGITSSDVATRGLDVRKARVLGQILPGVPVWRLDQGSRWPGLGYVVFPGNVGHDGALADIVRILRG